jgi:tRNA dimethylallyltransferase
MVELGMFQEIESFWDDCKFDNLNRPDYTRGILQAIGFKEFHEYLSMRQSLNPSDPETDQTLKKLRDNGIESMKTGTRQYARRQVTWLKNKLVPPLLFYHRQDSAGIYLIDATGKLD